MRTLTLFVGNNDSTVADAAKLHDSSAYLIDFSNCNSHHTGTCYTSLADMPSKNEFIELFRQAETIIYIPSDNWSDTSYTTANRWTKSKKIPQYQSKMQHTTERLLQLFSLSRYTKIINCPAITAWESITESASQTMLELMDHRKTDNPQLWVAGCSFTYGVGVEIEERYANLLANSLQLPVSVIADVASSITWAASQILRSDIRKDDIVVWGITDICRYPYYLKEENIIEHIHINTYKWFPEFHKKMSVMYLDDPTLLYNAISAIYQVINFCNKIGAKLVLAGLLVSSELGEYLNNNTPNYIHLSHRDNVVVVDYIDYAKNNQHPGPISHQWFADNILTLLKELQYIS